MKKHSVALLLVLILVVVIVAIAQYQLSQKSSVNLPKPVVRETIRVEEALAPATITPVEKFVSVSIDFGDGKIVSDQVEATNAYEALKKITGKKDLTVELKQYKYGMLVEKIGEKENSTGFSWKYFVNGEAGKVAPNLYAIKVKDRVEWKYVRI